MDVESTNPSNELAFSFTPPPPISTTKYSSKISPSILLIIFILAIIFFISGILHLLVRFLLRPTVRDAEDSDNGTALQGQLQELFHLHDAGVDQSFIDTLPVFLYRAIIGLKDPFDCAVCLSEFEPHDKLRLLPKCSHAFHIECIDTWLLCHSTCPLCRRSLFPDFSPVCNSFSPVVVMVESGSESSRESLPGGNDFEASKISEVVMKEEEDERVVSVKLGKYRNVDVGEGSSDGDRSIGKNQRRCFSMGSCEYVMDESCVLQVALSSMKRKKISNASNLSKRESFSFSKIWLQPRREAAVLGRDSSRRALSFRSPPQRDWESGSEVNLDVEAGGCVNSECSQMGETPSFARRTLLWIVGRQNKGGI